MIYMMIPNPSEIVAKIKSLTLIVFVIVYAINCMKLLFNKNIKFYKEIRSIYFFVIAFLFALLTNFQPWYFMWLTVFMIWQNGKNIKLIIEMQILTLFANIVFLIWSESYIHGPKFFSTFIAGIAICMIGNSKFLKNKIKKHINQITT